MSVPREESLRLLNDYVKNDKMIAHCIASEAVMKALAAKLGEDQCKWGTAGLLHDVDVEITNADMKIHGLKAGRYLNLKTMTRRSLTQLRCITKKQQEYRGPQNFSTHLLQAKQ